MDGEERRRKRAHLHTAVVDAVRRKGKVSKGGVYSEGRRAHIRSLNLIPESLYSSATFLQVLRNSPSPSFMMLALCTQVTVCGRRMVSK